MNEIVGLPAVATAAPPVARAQPAPTLGGVGVRADLIDTLTSLVRAHGAAGALDEVRRLRPPVHAGRYHDTLAVYYVWAVDRLVTAGLSDDVIRWHPLVDGSAPLGWWDPESLGSPEAAGRYVEPTVAPPREPESPREGIPA